MGNKFLRDKKVYWKSFPKCLIFLKKKSPKKT